MTSGPSLYVSVEALLDQVRPHLRWRRGASAGPHRARTECQADVKRLIVVDHPRHAESLLHHSTAFGAIQRVDTIYGRHELVHRVADESRLAMRDDLRARTEST